MKYEFKPFLYTTYPSDLSEGWKPTYRSTEERPCGTPREIEVVDLGEKAHWQFRLASIDLKNGGEVNHHDIYGRFDLKGVPSCLDLILYREAGPKPRGIPGYALVNDLGEVFSVQLYAICGGAESYKSVPCTITLHEPA